MNRKIYTTLGPASLNKQVVSSFDNNQVDLFRINLSHTPLSELESTVDMVRLWSDTDICFDSEGAQLRNQKMENGEVEFYLGQEVKINFDEILGDSNNISFKPDNIASQLRVKDKIRVDFDQVELSVIEKHKDHCLAIVDSPGKVGSNKAADVNRPLKFDILTVKDLKAIKLGLNLGIRHFALSFTNSQQDVTVMRKLCGPDSCIISKIESVGGLNNLESILTKADEILIDRGDLSRQVAIEKIPFLQRKIISSANRLGKPVLVATNLLESMVEKKVPTRAEVNDVVSTLEMGASGLVLAAETAIGKFPEKVVKMISDLIGEFEKWDPKCSFNEIINS